MQPKDDEDYNFFATIRTPNTTLDHVLCRLWRPRRMTDRIRMLFFPTQRQADVKLTGRLNPFAVRGKIAGLPGNAITIQANECWTERVPTRSLSRSRHETVFEADPIDLQILVTARADKRRSGKVKTYVDYILVPGSLELGPVDSVMHLGTGATRVKPLRRFSFTIKGNRRLSFVNRYHHEVREDEEIAWHELAARERIETPRTTFGKVDRNALDDLDDFLLLVSFSSRFQVVCVGLEAVTEHGDHFTFYRKNITVPKRQGRQDFNDAVVDLSDFEAFIRKAYRVFVRSGTNGPDELLRHALHLVMPRQDRTVESEFTTLYAALETLALWHRQRVGLEFIIEKETDWKMLREDISDFLKKHPLLESDKEKRRLIKNKLGELRRVPFGDAFARFCSDYSVDLSDLWPVIGRHGEMSLSEIRNHIVHGNVLQWSQWVALADAREHLRWTVERMLLAIFGWPIADSKVRPEWLARNRPAMSNLPSARRTMQGLQALPDDLANLINE